MQAPVLMIQGTASHAGKSIIAAALCRIFAKRGLNVAPYKSQNMALNSYVTPDGKEIGRAQAYQAKAAGVEISVDFNPILLKPSSDTGSQVIVLGTPIGHMKVQEYHAAVHALWENYASKALERLRASYDLVIAEGAGSPAEINLRHKDIANMHVALFAKASVILVADIDRGGVFANLLGTWHILAPEERALVKGYIINKFRGDASLLTSGIDFIKKQTGMDCLGVVPFLKNWHGEEEDSLGIENVQSFPPDKEVAMSSQRIKIGVVRLPYMSNYTDFLVLMNIPEVYVKFFYEPPSCNEAHEYAAFMIPGSKSVISDLEWLRTQGWGTFLHTWAKQGKEVVGICGGYQMLGNTLLDPEGVESSTSSAQGLKLLNTTTTYFPQKTLRRSQGVCYLFASPCKVEGYEIHMGQTTLEHGAKTFAYLDYGVSDGCINAAGNVWGTYLHGIWDSSEFCSLWLNKLCQAQKLPFHFTQDYVAQCLSIDTIEIMAQHVAKYVDIEKIASWFYPEA